VLRLLLLVLVLVRLRRCHEGGRLECPSLQDHHVVVLLLMVRGGISVRA
jgi:hypothetical protein